MDTNKKQIYFPMKKNKSIIFFRLLFLIIFLNTNIIHSKIIYDKNDITISEIEFNYYLKFYNNNYNIELDKNNAIKNLVLIKKTIQYVLINNPEFMKQLDEKIKLEFGEKVFNDKILINFVRFQRIKNEFISEYFKIKFDVNELKLIISSFNELKLPISKNNCLTIEKLHSVKNDEMFLFSFYENLMNNNKISKTKIDDIIYDVCIDNKTFKSIEKSIIEYIENKTNDDFSKFIYEKLN